MLSAMAVAKARVLAFVREQGRVGSEEVAAALGYTMPGAASTLLRLHRHGHLRRQREGQAFGYTLSEKGERYLRFVGEG
jgi:Mn-dependent DtxR family transcriptional regulator